MAPEPDKRGTALASIRKGMLSVFAIFVVWFLAWPQAAGDISEGDRALHLIAWLTLRQQITEATINSAQESSETALTHWPVPSQYDLHLVKIFEKNIDGHTDLPNYGKLVRMQVYRVDAKQSRPNPYLRIPYDNYLVREAVFSQRTVVAIFDKWCLLNWIPDIVDELDSCSISENGPHPRWWTETRALLWSRVESGDPYTTVDLDKLTPTSALVDKYLGDVNKEAFTVLGMQLNAGLFYCVVGILIGGISLSLLAPLTAIYSQIGPDPNPWLLTLTWSGNRGYLIETLVAVISVAWALIPAAVLYLQYVGLKSYSIELSLVETSLLYLGNVLMIVALIINFCVIGVLALVRTNARRVDPTSLESSGAT